MISTMQRQTAEIASLRRRLTIRTVLYWLCLITVVGFSFYKLFKGI